MLAFLKLIALPIIRLFFSVEYHGLENVPSRGRVILAANHPSYLDPVLMAVPVERRIRFMAWDALFKVPVLGQVIKSLGAFPVDIRKGRGEAAFNEARRVLESDEALGIFPEGRRSDAGSLGALRSGVARLAIETGSRIVPVSIGGASRAWPTFRLLPRPAKIVVRYHAPVDPRDPGVNEVQEVILEKLANTINRSLIPSLKEDQALERWYRQPPSHIRTYEWAPLIAAAVAMIVAREASPAIWLAPLLYYAYLLADLALIPPSRLAKWLRNSMPVWLIAGWHYQLMGATGLPLGDANLLLLGSVLIAFFPFFWQDYFTLQKFVRGVVVTYYFATALLLAVPNRVGVLVSTTVFVVLFYLKHRPPAYRGIVIVQFLAIGTGIGIVGEAYLELPAFAAISVVALLYLQTFVTAAYDIRRARPLRLIESDGASDKLS